MYNLVKAGKKFKINFQGMYIPYNKLKKNDIAFLKVNNTGHYVVIKGLNNGKIYILDPVYGNLNLNLEKFKSCYSGVAIVIKDNKYNTKLANNKKVSNDKMSKLVGGKFVGYAYLVPSGLRAFSVDFSFLNPRKKNSYMQLTFKKASHRIYISGL